MKNKKEKAIFGKGKMPLLAFLPVIQCVADKRLMVYVVTVRNEMAYEAGERLEWG